MSLRTAGTQSSILLAAVFLFGAWVAVTVFRVYDVMPSIWQGDGVEAAGEAIGQVPLSGLIGLLVMLVVLGLLIAVYSALSETEPLPDRFPPERGDFES